MTDQDEITVSSTTHTLRADLHRAEMQRAYSDELTASHPVTGATAAHLIAWIAPIILVTSLAVIVALLGLRLDREIVTEHHAQNVPTPLIAATPEPAHTIHTEPTTTVPRSPTVAAKTMDVDQRFISELRQHGINVLPGTERAFSTHARDVCTTPDLQAWVGSEEVGLTNNALTDSQVTYMIRTARELYCD